jgi:RimJ/RimL family protein N-acetyltransferase
MVERVVATTMFINERSRHVIEKCGMRHSKTFSLAFQDPLPGTEYGEVSYEITRQEWEKQ